MSSLKFTEEDFTVFNIDGLEPRMDMIKRRLRPKFEIVGEQIAPFLTMQVQEPVTVHIAKHARRTVNPPEETWIAWSTSKRSYKSLPHFQFGIRDLHLFVWFALIYECEHKAQFARNLRAQLDEIWPLIPDTYYISQDHTKPDVTMKKEMEPDHVAKMLDRLEKVKKAEFLCGILIPREEAVALSGEDVIKRIEETFQQLDPLYKLATS
ncbi:YktB family protein [Paenactinomyces guangxiensis]|uniref:UPF0637 protein H1191_08225 n=1 Tax=Paenactinomyces guangxiensis TaxID=1490290 RepID=A0A7W1WQN6_9BACL|nr:DUF1054 domain-containing protein [Paenactinomyces guangxiensis]MBA4494290.1 DUF1054 domain-containing protein [Paenactinomyces guangxiensis]MBH8590784.1 DUF1054 domain-containing protein [Paenactinomyces guangxiensis]